MRLFFRFTLFLCIIPFIHIVTADGASWVEDFNDSSFESWIKHDPNNRTTWQPKDGNLDVWAQPFPPPGIYDKYALQFKGFQFDAQTISVQLKILEARGASVGILIGQYDKDRQVSIYRNTVAFLHTTMLSGVIFKPKDFELIKKDKTDKTIPTPLKAIEISFDKGDFEVYTKRQFIARYQIPQLKTVNFIGIVSLVGMGRGAIAHFVLDDFVISGPNVPAHGTLDVRSKDKAAVLWGKLKKR